MSGQNDKTIETYNSAFEKYLTNIQPLPVDHVKIWLNKAISNLPITAKILEIGSAGGTEADYLESQGYSVIRSDVIDGFIQYNEAKGRNCLRLNAIKDDLPVQCDLIFANAVLLHFTKVEAQIFFKKCYESLSPNGKLALTTKQGQGDYWQMNVLDSPRFEQFWQADELETKLNAVGFKITDLVKSKSSSRNITWIELVASRN